MFDLTFDWVTFDWVYLLTFVYSRLYSPLYERYSFPLVLIPELCGLCYQSSGGFVRRCFWRCLRCFPVSEVFPCFRRCLWCFPEFRWPSVSVPVILRCWSHSAKILPCVADGQPVPLYDAGRRVVRRRSSWFHSTASWSRHRRDVVHCAAQDRCAWPFVNTTTRDRVFCEYFVVCVLIIALPLPLVERASDDIPRDCLPW